MVLHTERFCFLILFGVIESRIREWWEKAEKWFQYSRPLKSHWIGRNTAATLDGKTCFNLLFFSESLNYTRCNGRKPNDLEFSVFSSSSESLNRNNTKRRIRPNQVSVFSSFTESLNLSWAYHLGLDQGVAVSVFSSSSESLNLKKFDVDVKKMLWFQYSRLLQSHWIDDLQSLHNRQHLQVSVFSSSSESLNLREYLET